MRIRDAALNDETFLTRRDLSPRHKLTILSLRDQFSRSEIEALPASALIQALPTDQGSAFSLPEGQKIRLTRVEEIDILEARVHVYFGAEPRNFAAIRTNAGWQLDLQPLFDPASLHRADVALLMRVADYGEPVAQAWLQLYAELSGQTINEDLLKLP